MAKLAVDSEARAAMQKVSEVEQERIRQATY